MNGIIKQGGDLYGINSFVVDDFVNTETPASVATKHGVSPAG